MPDNYCKLVDTDKNDGIYSIICKGYETFVEGYAHCLSKAQLFETTPNQMNCSCDVNLIPKNNDLLLSRIICDGQYIFGSTGEKYTYKYYFPPENADPSQVIEIFGVNVMFAIGIVCGILTTLLLSRG